MTHRRLFYIIAKIEGAITHYGIDLSPARCANEIKSYGTFKSKTCKPSAEKETGANRMICGAARGFQSKRWTSKLIMVEVCCLYGKNYQAS